MESTSFISLVTRTAGLLLAACLLAPGQPARAGTLVVTPASTAITLLPGEQIAVTGHITNLTGMPLYASDIWLNFSGYPAGTLALTQVLGQPEIVLDDRTVSPLLTLFTIDTLAGAQLDAVYTFEFFAVDTNGVYSDSVAMNVTLVPEPVTVMMLACGLLLMVPGAWASHCSRLGDHQSLLQGRMK